MPIGICFPEIYPKPNEKVEIEHMMIVINQSKCNYNTVAGECCSQSLCLLITLHIHIFMYSFSVN